MEVTAQVLGYIITLLCILTSQFKKKWQMLSLSFLANFLNIPMFWILNGGLTSAVMVSVVGCTQCAVNGALAYRGRVASVWQKIVFTGLYLTAGVLQYKTALDILPIVGSLLFMCGTFQRKEQMMRLFGLANGIVWVAYNGIIESTAIYAQIFSICSTLIALYRYRNQKAPSSL